MKKEYPLIKNNINRSDLNKVINYLKKKDPILTQSKNVEFFEKKWSEWLGVRYSVFLNSGSSANLLSVAYLKTIYSSGEILVPALTWVSDVNSIILNGFKPVFVDIEMKNLSMNENEIFKKINKKTIAIFITYAQGFNALSDKLLSFIKKRNIMLIEDVCESHGATYKKRKLGTFGIMSNFSFYYAHHMSTIEGGMVCTNDENIYQNLRMLRSHGMLRESNNFQFVQKNIKKHNKLNESFIFMLQGYNFRNNEIGALIGINQLKRLDKNIEKRNINHKLFLKNLNSKYYFTNFDLKGSSNYAFNLILKNKNKKFLIKLMNVMDENGIEYRRGSAGGGNQLRQPYLKKIIKKNEWLNYPITEHIHFYGFYIGNYPDLNKEKILKLCRILNSI